MTTPWGRKSGTDRPRPMAFDELTAEQVGKALCECYPGAEVTELRLARALGGTGSKAQLLPGCNRAGQGHGLARSIHAERGFNRHSHAIKKSHIHEAIFRANWPPRGTANIPKGFSAHGTTTRACRLSRT